MISSGLGVQLMSVRVELSSFCPVETNMVSIREHCETGICMTLWPGAWSGAWPGVWGWSPVRHPIPAPPLTVCVARTGYLTSLGPFVNWVRNEDPCPQIVGEVKSARTWEARASGAQREAAKAGCKSCGGPCRPQLSGHFLKPDTCVAPIAG